MAYSWKDAQKKEQAFYDKIYKKRQGDTASYWPVTPEKCMAFAKMTVERFGYTLDELKGKVIADVGCGPHGIIKGIELYADRTQSSPRKTYGIDPLMDAYKEYGLLTNNEVTQLITAKGEDIPLDDESCDYVFCTNAVDHVDRPELVIREARRICKKGGVFCMSVHVVNAFWIWSRPFLFLVDKNHPHHFHIHMIVALARKHFARVTVCRRVSVVEDHPEFTFANVLKSQHRCRAAKRWLSNVMLSSVYVRCTGWGVGERAECLGELR
jgi:ubiquinone/menaquinone biosynthesis C-methylase UbiE